MITLLHKFIDKTYNKIQIFKTPKYVFLVLIDTFFH